MFRLSFQKSDIFVGRLLVVWTIQSRYGGEKAISPGQQKVRWVRLGCSETFGNWNLHDHESFSACPVMFSDIYFQYRHILLILHLKNPLQIYLIMFFWDYCSQGSVKRFNMSKSSAFTPPWKQTFPEVVCSSARSRLTCGEHYFSPCWVASTSLVTDPSTSVWHIMIL